MEVKGITSWKAPSYRSIPSRDLAITTGDLPKYKASSSGPYVDATAGDGVTEMLGRLQLTSQESNAFILDDEDEDDLGYPEWVLAWKVLAPNTLHISTIKAALRLAWGNPKGLEMHAMGRNLFLVEFATKADKTHITEGSPWIVGTHAVLLKDFDPSVKPADRHLEGLSLWARILNLRYGLMNDQRGKDLASHVERWRRSMWMMKGGHGDNTCVFVLLSM
ncbi:hypothetical protein ACQ4PT_017335 [Festuca glaucescens]